MYINKNILRTFIACIALAACAPLLNAQKMRYVTYFPTPHAYYSQLNVGGFYVNGVSESVALLATFGHNYWLESEGVASGEIIVGSSERFAIGSLAAFKSNTSFTAKNMFVQANLVGNVGASIDMSVQSVHPSQTLARNSDGLFGAYGAVNIILPQPPTPENFAPWAIVANEKLIVGDLKWSNNGSSMGNIMNGILCPSGTSPELKWKQLRLKHNTATSRSFRTYLTYRCI